MNHATGNDSRRVLDSNHPCRAAHVLVPLVSAAALISLAGGCGRSARTAPDAAQGPERAGPIAVGNRLEQETGAAPVVRGTDVLCDVIVAGGSTAALSAALTSAREGRATCLLEPTDWPGGQLTSVPAIDFPHHTVAGVDLRVEGVRRENLNTEFHDWTMGSLRAPGTCSVSRVCYEPKRILTEKIYPAIQAEPNLKVFYSTVVKSVKTTPGTSRNIVSVEGIARTPVDGTKGYESFLHQSLSDWYSRANSSRFTKRSLTFRARGDTPPVVIDATEFGDVLALSGASYLQGVDPTDGALSGQAETCGQAMVFPFVATLERQPVDEPRNPFTVQHPKFYGFGSYDWDRIWIYRRVRSTAAGTVRFGDWSLQNWNPGNDYPFKYLFLNRAQTNAQRADWKGGVNLDAIRGAESHAYGWYHHFKEREPTGYAAHVRLLRHEALGTGTGLTKMPYVRDTRRSVGLDGFVIKYGDLLADPQAGRVTGTRFSDTLAIGAYVADIHSVFDGCVSPRYLNERILDVAPSHIPFRALTNRDFDNLLVAGKTMAQSYKVNSALRLQPIEWHAGVAAGAAAAHMSQFGLSSRTALASVGDIRERVQKYQPTRWTLGNHPARR